MSKIIEKNNEEITNLDGARFNRFCAGNEDLIIKSAYSECALTLATSNSISIAKGVVIIDGFQVVIENAAPIVFSTLPSTPTNYQIILQLEMDSDSQPSLSIFAREVSALVQNDLYDTTLSQRIYQVELGTFTADSWSLSSLVRTLKVKTKTGATSFEHVLEFTYNKSQYSYLYSTITITNHSSTPITLDLLKARATDHPVPFNNARGMKPDSFYQSVEIYPLYLYCDNNVLYACVAGGQVVVIDESYLEIVDYTLSDEGTATTTVTLEAARTPSSGGGGGGGGTMTV